jgi:hypothetical protein
MEMFSMKSIDFVDVVVVVEGVWNDRNLDFCHKCIHQIEKNEEDDG